jgi:arylsulfatase
LNLDRFYKVSVRFTDFHVSPTSSATRAALLTGRHEFRSGVTHTSFKRNRLQLDAVTIAQVLKSAGYATGIFGKWHLGDQAPYWPNQRGFEEMFIHGGAAIGQSDAGGGDVPGNSHFNPVMLHNGEFTETLGFSTDVIFRHAIEWMDDQIDAGKPYFACIMPTAAQPPLCPPEYERHYLRKNVSPELAPFCGMVSNLDENFGMLLDKIQEWGSEENTLIIFLTDHGGTAGVDVFNGGMRGGAATPYEGGTRVPSFWRWTGHWTKGADVSALTAHLDVFPTLVHIAGAQIPAALAPKFDGRDLLPLLENPSHEWPDRILFTHVGGWPTGLCLQFQHTKCSVRDSRFSLVNDSELYDLQADPGQGRNVLGDHPDEGAGLRAAYEQWWKEVLPVFIGEDSSDPGDQPFRDLYRKQYGIGPTERPPGSR